MQVALLGPLAVHHDAQPIEVGGARLRALLIRLAASANGWVPVGELVEALWDQDPPGDELNALQSLISRLRRALPKPELIESGPAGYRLAIDPESVDAIKFERLAGRGRRLLADGDPRAASVLLTEAIGLWRGPVLTEVATAGYAVGWIERLQRLRLTTVEHWAAAGLQLGRHAELIAELEELAAGNPLRERTHELLARALAGTGRQHEALEVLAELRRNLAEQLGLVLPGHLSDLQVQVLRGDPQLQPPTVLPPMRPPVQRRRRTNLRTPLTSFIGGGSSVLQVRELLAEARLVTLVGTGGAGKTRLACEVAGGLSRPGTDGVWLVELAPVLDPDDLASAVLGSIDSNDASLLNRSTPSYQDAISRLVETIADLDVVVVLDNCEHVVDAAAKLAESLLGQCPNLTVLATSREPLGIVGEKLCPVAPLPAPAENTEAMAVSTFAAVELFVDRAVLVRPGFRVTAHNALAVAEICRRLDGLPLAIELAAARLRNLPVETVAARLSNRFRLLSGGNRAALPRHQTLRAVVAWSWDLLTDAEKRLAERLSVFPGSADVQSIAMVCAHDPTAPNDDELITDDVQDLLTALADKSLLVLDASRLRYRMLETIREYAAERLAENDELPSLRSAHARYFLRLAETAEPKLRGPEQLIWLERTTLERDNLQAAMRFAVEAGDADTAVRFGAALSWYWTIIGRHDEARHWLGQVLQVPGERSPVADAISRVMHAMSVFAGDGVAPTPEMIDGLLALITDLDLRTANPLLSLVEPAVALIRDDHEGIRKAVERNLVHSDTWARAMLHLMNAMTAENDGNLEQMERNFPLALEGFRQTGDRWGTGSSLSALAILSSNRGDTEGAIAALEEARALMTELRAQDDEAYTLTRIGLLRLRLPDLAGARQDIERALQIADESGAPTSMAFTRFGMSAIVFQEGNVEDARGYANEALKLMERRSYAPPQVKALVICSLAGFDLAQGKLAEGRAKLIEALERALATRDMPITASVCTTIARLTLLEGDPERAAEVLGIAISLRGMQDTGDLDVREVSALARAALGAQGYDRAWARGRELLRPEAFAVLKTVLDAETRILPGGAGVSCHLDGDS